MHKLILIVAVAVFATACGRRAEKECDMQELMDCSTRYLNDSLGLAKAIPGKWKWEYQLSCFVISNDDPSDDQSYEGLIIEFRTEGSGEYTRKNNTGRFTWQLRRRDNRLFFEIDNATNVPFPPHDTLYGTIFLCEDKLMMSSRAEDGTDNIFKRS
jgi:hypothetical protein